MTGIIDDNTITFLICTQGAESREALKRCVQSIANTTNDFGPNWKTDIIIGTSDCGILPGPINDGSYTRITYVNLAPETKLTTKKNKLVEAAKAKLNGKWTMILHDYYVLPKDFMYNFTKWACVTNNQQYMIAQPRIVNDEGLRHSDWAVDPLILRRFLMDKPILGQIHKGISPNESPEYVCGLPYHHNTLRHIQYISGGFMLAKTHIFQSFPFNENLDWGQSEDLEWSRRIAGAQIPIGFVDLKDPVIALKPNKWHMRQMPDSTITALEQCFVARLPTGKNKY